MNKWTTRVTEWINTLGNEWNDKSINETRNDKICANEKENERAEAKGYKSPICETKTATDTCFNEVLNYILNK